MVKIIKQQGWATVLMFVVLLNGCTATLAPSYDQAIYNGLSEVSPKIISLFLSVETAGATETNFVAFEERYNNLIGKVDVLVMQSRARPVPDNTYIEKLNKQLKKEQKDTLELRNGNVPSTYALQEISANIVEIRDIHKEKGASTGLIKLYKGETLIYLDQAITYESALKR